MKKNVVIVLLVIIVLGLGGYLVYDKVIKKDEKKKVVVDVEKDTEFKDFDISETNKLLDEFGFNKRTGLTTTVLDGSYSETIKMMVALSKVDKSKQNEKKCSEVFPKSSYDETQKAYVTSFKNSFCEENNNTTVIKYEDANEIYKRMYGTEMPKKSINFLSVGNEFSFNTTQYLDESNLFATVTCRCGGAGPAGFILSKIKDSKIKDNILVINLYYESIAATENDNFIYVTDPITNKVYQLNENNREEIKNEISKQLESSNIYQITFEKNNDNFTLKSVVKIIG